MQKLLEIKNLSIEYYRDEKIIPAVRSVDLLLGEGEVLGLVGESGCGKSTVALSIIGLLPKKQSKITQGEVHFQQQNLLSFSEQQWQQSRGNKISIVFQEAFSSLNPVFTVGGQIQEAIKTHHPAISTREAKQKTIAALKRVHISEPEERFHAYPHQLSGGMQQRTILAMALAGNPKILIADEPTTALDVTIQHQILKLLQELRTERSMAIFLITHNLAIVHELADRVAIMYAGEIVETAAKDKIFNNPLHPYTVGLLNSIPDIKDEREKLSQIKGQIPDITHLPQGCPFQPRCPDALDICQLMEPEMLEWEEGHEVRCFKYCV